MKKIFKNKVKTGVIGVIVIVISVSAWYWLLTTDEFGTPRIMWNWTYGLIGGEIEVLSCEGFNTDFGGSESFWDNIPFLSTMLVMQEHEGEMLIVGSAFRTREIQENESEMLLRGETFILNGSGYWDYVQVRVNGELVRHRWPQADARYLVQLGVRIFQTEPLNLNIGRNEVVLTAIWENNCVIRTVYLIRNE